MAHKIKRKNYIERKDGDNGRRCFGACQSLYSPNGDLLYYYRQPQPLAQHYRRRPHRLTYKSTSSKLGHTKRHCPHPTSYTQNKIIYIQLHTSGNGSEVSAALSDVMLCLQLFESEVEVERVRE